MAGPTGDPLIQGGRGPTPGRYQRGAYAGFDASAEGGVELRGRGGGLAVHPGAQQRHECPHHADHQQVERGRSAPACIQQLLPDHGGQQLLATRVHQAAAAPPQQRPYELPPLVHVLKHRQAEGEQLARPPGRLGVEEAELVEVAEQRVLLVGEAGVEGGAAHVRAVDDVGDGDRVVALLQDQRHERLLDGPPSVAR
nr:hypothetical protein [Nonomuraea cypriaca]